MRVSPTTLVVIAITVALTPTDARAQEVSRLVGTWVLNREASALGPNGIRRMVRTYEDRGDGLVRATIVRIDSRGRRTSSSYTARHDGTDYRFIYRGRAGDGYRTINFTPVDAYSSNWVRTLNGAVSQMGQNRVSVDGLTLMVTIAGATQVFDRQPQ